MRRKVNKSIGTKNKRDLYYQLYCLSVNVFVKYFIIGHTHTHKLSYYFYQ